MNIKTKSALLAAVIFWSSAFVGIRAGLLGYSPEGLALLRFMVGSVIMIFVYSLMPKSSRANWKSKAGLFVTGMIGIGIYSIALNRGEIAISSGVASFIISQSPVLTTLFAVLFLGERLTPTRILGFIVSLIGVCVIAYGEIGDFEMNAGLIYILIATFTGSCFSIMQKPFLKSGNSIESSCYVIWGGTAFLAIYTPNLLNDFNHANLAASLVVVYLGIFPTVIAYIAWAYILNKLPVAQAVSYLYTLPFVTAVMGWLFLGEVPATTSIFGAVIAIIGVWLVNNSYERIVEPPLQQYKPSTSSP